jgi:cytochrome c oxidase assembly factor CtaG
MFMFVCVVVLLAVLGVPVSFWKKAWSASTAKALYDLVSTNAAPSQAAPKAN